MSEYAPNQSKRIQETVDAWVAAGRKSSIRRRADHISTGRSYWSTFYGMGVMADALKKKGQPVPGIWMAVIEGSLDATLLFFAETEEEVLNRIGPLKPKNNPRNVLVKMTALRIRKIRSSIECHSTINISTRTKCQQIRSIFPLNTVKKCQYLIEQRHDFYTVSLFKTFLAENPIDDSIVEEAWNLTEVAQIMES